MNDLGAMRAACERLAASIVVPQPFKIRDFCDIVGERRGRFIRLKQTPNMAGEDAPYGMWIAYRDEDHILTEKHTSELHRTQIVLHECAHMLCNHAPNLLKDEDFLRKVAPDLKPAAAMHFFARHGYTKREEREAELVASILLGRTGLNHAEAVPAGDTGTLSRLSEALGHPRRDERRA